MPASRRIALSRLLLLIAAVSLALLAPILAAQQTLSQTKLPGSAVPAKTSAQVAAAQAATDKSSADAAAKAAADKLLADAKAAPKPDKQLAADTASTKAATDNLAADAAAKAVSDKIAADAKAAAKSKALLAGPTLHSAGCGLEYKDPCELKDTLGITFDDLEKWMDAAEIKQTSLYIVLNGREFKGLIAHGLDTNYTSLMFDLTLITTGPNDNRALWNTVIGEVRNGTPLHVSVGYGADVPFPPPVTVGFNLFPRIRTIAMIVILLVLAVGFIILAQRSDIVRDAPSILGIKQTFSLARCQMAWWFFIVAGAYSYIWVVLNNHDSLTDGVLILTGISAGTGLAATVVGNDSTDPAKQQVIKDQAATQVSLTDRVAALPALIASEPDPARKTALEAEQADKKAQLTVFANKGKSQGFLFDILRDTEGISFHRFQLAGWTVILGIVFISAVWSEFTMPDFSATLLGLMGISSGTYLGFKISNTSK